MPFEFGPEGSCHHPFVETGRYLHHEVRDPSDRGVDDKGAIVHSPLYDDARCFPGVSHLSQRGLGMERFGAVPVKGVFVDACFGEARARDSDGDAVRGELRSQGGEEPLEGMLACRIPRPAQKGRESRNGAYHDNLAL